MKIGKICNRVKNKEQKMVKMLWVDTETTGLDPVKNDIIQLAGIVEIDGVVKEEFNIKCQPFDYETISPQALETNKMNVEQLKMFQAPQIAYKQLVSILDKYVDKYNKADKFTPVGQNVQFDINFLRQFFVKNNNKFFGSYVDYHSIDLMALSGFFTIIGKIKPENLKLGTIAEIMKVEFNAHDALEDIKATREIMLSFRQFIKE
jgi:DNA polymerase-3 subunit epsilon